MEKKRNGGACTAIGCNMRRGTNLLSEVRMFNYPRDLVRRIEWTIAVRRRDFTPTNNTLLCNAHFVTGKPSNDPHHPDYVPSIFTFDPKSRKRAEVHLKAYEKISTLRNMSIPKYKSVKHPNRPFQAKNNNICYLKKSSHVRSVSESKNSTEQEQEKRCTDRPVVHYIVAEQVDFPRNDLSKDNDTETLSRE